MKTSAKLEKAYLALVAPPNPATKPPALSSITGKARAGGVGQVIFTFNPGQFTITKTASWQRQPQRGAKQTAMPEFTGSNPATLKLSVLFDGSEASNPSVAGDVQRLLDAVTPLQESLSRDKPTPPWVVFGWGKFMSFVAVVTSVSATYTMFLPDGTPIRAKCEIDLQEVPTDPPPRQNPTSGARTAHRTHRLVAGDTLPSVAQREYGDPGLWRVLANLNDVDDPLRLTAGTTLLIPSQADLPDVN